jgi:hypothetical protein
MCVVMKNVIIHYLILILEALFSSTKIFQDSLLHRILRRMHVRLYFQGIKSNYQLMTMKESIGQAHFENIGLV